MIIATILSIIGLICDFVAGIVLLPRIFISDDELKMLSELPIEPSTTNMTGKNTRKNLPVAVTEVEDILEYRNKYIEARKQERKNGRIGLALLVSGSFLQAIGMVVGIF